MTEKLQNQTSGIEQNETNPWTASMTEIINPDTEPSPQSWQEAMADMPANPEDQYYADSDSEVSESRLESDQIDPNNPETRAERNRNKFNQVTRRLVYIKNAYPDINAAPESVQDEMMYLETSRNRLAGFNSGMHSMGAGIAEDGAIINNWKLQEYNDDIKKQRQLRSDSFMTNALDPLGEAAIELPKVDIEQLQNQVDNISTDYNELTTLDQALESAQEYADYDTYMKLSAMKREASNNWGERTHEAEAAELERLQNNLEAAEKNLQEARESYQKLTIFHKAWTKLNRSDNRKALESERRQATRDLNIFKKQMMR